MDIAVTAGTLSPKLLKHPLTDNGISQLLKDWNKVPETLKTLS